MKKTIIFFFLFASLALAQSQRQGIVVFPSVADDDAKFTSKQLDALTEEVRTIITKTLPQKDFNLLKQDDVVEALGGEDSLFKACSEKTCFGSLMAKFQEAKFGTRCDVYIVDKQLYLKFELYGTLKGESEAGTIRQESYPVKDFAEMQALIKKEVPSILDLIGKSEQERCLATPGKMWVDDACVTGKELAQKDCLQKSNEGYVWDGESCKSREQIICEGKKGHKWEGNHCKSPEELDCDKKGWQWANGKCNKPAVAMPPPAPIPVPSGVAPGMGDGGSGYRAQIQTEPAGASLNLNGAPYCNSTPCPISVYERSVRLTATLNDYETADTTVNITMPDQIVKIKLKQKVYPVDVATEPSGVSVALEGEADFFECQTPCVWYFKKGNVKVSVRDKFYESKDTAIFVAKETEVNLKLNPNYGVLNIDPAYSDDIGKNESWSLTIDGEPSPLGEIKFLPGNYNGKLSHNCYEDIKIDNVRIEKDGRVDFDMSDKLALKQSGLVLKAERYYSSFFSTFNKQVSVPFSVNGKVAGETAFNGSVPLCSEIEIDSKKIDAKLESGGSVEYTYKMRSYMPSIISGIVGTALLAYGLYQNSEVENVYMKEYANKDIKTFVSVDQSKGEYDKAWDEVESTKTVRNLAYVLSGISFALGVVLWF